MRLQHLAIKNRMVPIRRKSLLSQIMGGAVPPLVQSNLGTSEVGSLRSKKVALPVTAPRPRRPAPKSKFKFQM